MMAPKHMGTYLGHYSNCAVLYSMHYTIGDQLGRVVLGGGCLFGIGSLCYYGLGLSGEAGAIDRAG